MGYLQRQVDGLYAKVPREGVLDSLRAWRSSRLMETFEGLSKVCGGGWGDARRGFGPGDDADILIDGYAAGVFLHLPHAEEQLSRLKHLRGRIAAGDFDRTQLPLERLTASIDGFSRLVGEAEVYASTYRDAVGARAGAAGRLHGHDRDSLFLDLHTRSLPEESYFRFQDLSWQLFEGMIRNDLLYLSSPDADYAADAYFVEGFFRSNPFVQGSEEVLGYLKMQHELQAHYDLLESYARFSEK